MMRTIILLMLFPLCLHAIEKDQKSFVELSNFRLATYKQTVPNAKGTVIILHGLYDHMGYNSYLSKWMHELQLNVAMYDLPGHGHSSGPRATIDKIPLYSETLIEFFTLIKKQMPAPYFFVAHSTGATAIIDALLKGEVKDKEFSKIILLAPLVRSNHWTISKWGHTLAYNILGLDEAPRKFIPVTSDEQFNKLHHNDPLQYRRVSLKWFQALREWNREFERSPSHPAELLVIQGAADKTVDWQYNLQALKLKFPDMQQVIIKKAGHHLHNEKEDLRAQVKQALTKYLLPLQ